MYLPMIHSLADAAMSVLNTVHKQEVEEVSRQWKMASPKVVARVEQYKRDQATLTGRQIRTKLVEDKVCSESELPNTPNTCLLYTSPSPRDS